MSRWFLFSSRIIFYGIMSVLKTSLHVLMSKPGISGK